MKHDPAPIVIFGEVLFDQFPDHTLLGGAPFNVAWHLQALGAKPTFVSRIGYDTAGDEVLVRMRDWGMSTAAMQRDPVHPTGAVQITLREGQPSYAILPAQAYDFIEPGVITPPTGGALLYHGSLAIRAPQSAAALEKLRQMPGFAVYCDVNLRSPWWQRDTLLRQLVGTRYIKLNHDELGRLLPALAGDAERLEWLHRHTGCDAVIVTRGAEGASVHTAAGDNHAVKPGPAVTVVDTVGAGDAFTAVTLFGLSRGWSWQTTLPAAQALASHVVAQRGALVESRAVYRDLLADWNVQL
ncbi:MAG: carbohydrate kinase [Thiotrichales bacterium]